MLIKVNDKYNVKVIPRSYDHYLEDLANETTQNLIEAWILTDYKTNLLYCYVRGKSLESAIFDTLKVANDVFKKVEFRLIELEKKTAGPDLTTKEGRDAYREEVAKKYSKLDDEKVVRGNGLKEKAGREDVSKERAVCEDESKEIVERFVVELGLAAVVDVNGQEKKV